MEPLRFVPQFVPKIWGGRRLETVLQKNLPSGAIGESWEISGHRANLTPVLNEGYAGQTIYDIAETHGAEAYGRFAAQCKREFPLLLKFLDASDVLSVQVHPDEESARAMGAEPKTEMWYVMDAADDAHVYLGLKPGVTREAFMDALKATQLETVLNRIEARPGTIIFVPAGGMAS